MNIKLFIYKAPFKQKITRIRALMSLVWIITILCMFIAFIPIPASCAALGISCYQERLTVFIAMVLILVSLLITKEKRLQDSVLPCIVQCF